MKPTHLLFTALLLAPLAAAPTLAGDTTAAGIQPEVQVAAYYFPNWGPVAQSEWRAIKVAKPRFEGHAQPKIPAWGFENENDPAVMARKIDAAADHGLDAFIFDWYYYDPDARGPEGQTVTGSPWDGSKYLYSALERGYLGAANNDRLQFAIMWCNHDLGAKVAGAVAPETFDSLTSYVWIHHYPLPDFPATDFGKAVNGYFRAVEKGGGYNGLEQPASSLPVPYHLNVTMGWDSSPRCKGDFDWMTIRRGYPFGPVIKNNTPPRFRAALARARELTLRRPPNERIITINSWNEWGEGSYLEPDTIHGMGYLEAIRSVFATAE